MKNKLSLRLKLSDFINSEIESNVMKQINKIHNELDVAVLLYLWFDNDEIKGTELKDFLVRWEDKLSFRTVVNQSSIIKTNDFIWFDIAPLNISKSSRKRFQFNYLENKQILQGLKEFYNVAKFTTTEKPIKKQKRNDYED